MFKKEKEIVIIIWKNNLFYITKNSSNNSCHKIEITKINNKIKM